jgi:hypothetical protein
MEHTERVVSLLAQRGVKGFLTVNVLVFTEELSEAADLIQAAAAAGAEDAGTIGCNCGDRYCTPQQVAAFVKGKRLAVDLSCWVVQCDNTQGAAGAPPEFRQTLYLRNIFYRALRISSTKYGGALPIFVSDPLIGSQVI